MGDIRKRAADSLAQYPSAYMEGLRHLLLAGADISLEEYAEGVALTEQAICTARGPDPSSAPSDIEAALTCTQEIPLGVLAARRQSGTF